MGTIRFGVIVPQGWLNDLPKMNGHKQFELAQKVALTAEKLGYDSIWAYDHFVPHYSYAPLEGKPMFECYTFLSALSNITKRVKIGQVVTCNSYRHPSLLAKIGSTLDVISNGRLEFGIGAGWYEEEYAAYGYDYPSDRTRIEQLDESLQIIKSMWSNVKTTFSGKYYKVKDAICAPKPLQKPHPLVMVGGTGEKYLLRVAARHTNRYNHPFGSPEEVDRKIKVLKEHCKAIKRDHKEIEKSVLTRIVVADSDNTARKIICRIKNKGESVDEYLERTKGKIAVGMPESVIKHLNKYVESGVSHFVLHFMGVQFNMDMLKLFASKVMKKI